MWLVSSNSNWGPKPFKFNNCWLEHEHFKSFVEEVWRSMNIFGSGEFVAKEKLKRLKKKLKLWNRDVFGILDLNIEKK